LAANIYAKGKNDQMISNISNPPCPNQLQNQNNIQIAYVHVPRIQIKVLILIVHIFNRGIVP